VARHAKSPDLAISLQRAGIGLALGFTVGIVTGVYQCEGYYPTDALFVAPVTTPAPPDRVTATPRTGLRWVARRLSA
jgi:hypothetical protein